MSPGRRGRGKSLTCAHVRADNGCVSSSGPTASRFRRRLRGERGQAMVEFALIAPLFLMIVVGIIQFGVALNYWLDAQRIANQGARWAAVNNWPLCTRDSADSPPQHDGTKCPGSRGNMPYGYSLQTYLAEQRGAQGEDLSVYICFPNGTSEIGDPVKVFVYQKFSFMAIVPSPKITLQANATMRLEQKPGRYVASTGGTCPS
jgi:Flp pilus assembly pilin Flp